MAIINIKEVWNSVAYKENKPLRRRDYVYASEIGNSIYDRVLKMRAVPYTNPPNKRSLRKFLAGNIWEYVTKQVLLCSGVFYSEEVVCNSTPFEGLPDVHGRVDFFVGGVVSSDEAMAKLQDAKFPEYLYMVAEKIIIALDGAEFEKSIFELKSCSSFAMDKIERMGKPLYNNASQAGYYQKALSLPIILAYVCKDDSRMEQFVINDNFDEFLKQDLSKIAEYMGNDKIPELEPLAKFIPELGKFEKNFNVEYSPYLSHYGFDTPDDYRGAVSYIESWNRVILRFAMAEYGYKDAKGNIPKITDKNKEVRREIESKGYNFNDIIEARKKAGLEEENEAE
jgi:hypothetical protein